MGKWLTLALLTAANAVVLCGTATASEAVFKEAIFVAWPGKSWAAGMNQHNPQPLVLFQGWVKGSSDSTA